MSNMKITGPEAPEVPTRVLVDDDYEVLRRFPNPLPSEHPVWFVLRTEDMHQHFSDREIEQDQIPRYHVSLLAVSPGFLKRRKAQWESALSCMGWTRESLADLKRGHDRATQVDIEVELLIRYGTYAVLWKENGDDPAPLEREARLQERAMHLLGGFRLDQPNQNAIGTTGWEALRGDLTGPLRRRS